MSKGMDKVFVVLVWATVVIVGLAIYLPKQRDNHIKLMGKACSQRVHTHFGGYVQNEVWGVGQKNAYSRELDAQTACIVQYPLTY